MESTPELRWAKWQQFPLPIFSSHILKHKFSVSKTFFKPTVWKHHILDLWDILKSDILAFFEQANFSETFITIILNSWPKCLTLLLTETVFLDTVTNIQRHMQDSTKTLFLMLRHIKFKQKGNLSMPKQTPLKKRLRKGVFQIVKNAWWTEATHTIWKKRRCEKYNSQKGKPRLSWQNTKY